MSKFPKVLMLVQNLPAPADPRVWAEATTLRDAGFQVSIICPKGRTHQETRTRIDEISIYRYRVPMHAGGFKGYCLEYCISLLMTFWLSLKVLLLHGFDVIHAANPPDFFFILGIFYRLFGKKYVFDQHDPVPEMFQVKFQKNTGWTHKLLLFLEFCSYKTANLVITTNLSQKRFAIERGGCSPQKVVVVRNGPNSSRMHPVPSNPELKSGRPYLLAYIGVMGIQDGVENTLYALHYLVYERGRMDVSLVLIGDGDSVPSLRKLVRTLQLDGFVTFAGWVAPEDVPQYLSTADIGLVPDPQNGMNEFCTMIKTMEYMAIGKPLVAFDLAETRFSAQEAALYAVPNQVADFAQKIEILLDDKEGRQRMGAAGIRRIKEELNWEYSRTNLLIVYKMLFHNLPIALEGKNCSLRSPRRRQLSKL